VFLNNRSVVKNLKTGKSEILEICISQTIDPSPAQNAVKNCPLERNYLCQKLLISAMKNRLLKY